MCLRISICVPVNQKNNFELMNVMVIQRRYQWNLKFNVLPTPFILFQPTFIKLRGIASLKNLKIEMYKNDANDVFFKNATYKNSY